MIRVCYAARDSWSTRMTDSEVSALQVTTLTGVQAGSEVRRAAEGALCAQHEDSTLPGSGRAALLQFWPDRLYRRATVVAAWR